MCSVQRVRIPAITPGRTEAGRPDEEETPCWDCSVSRRVRGRVGWPGAVPRPVTAAVLEPEPRAVTGWAGAWLRLATPGSEPVKRRVAFGAGGVRASVRRQPLIGRAGADVTR